MPQFTMKGRGEAYQSWYTDQATAIQNTSAPEKPPSLRPPVSASATICCRSSDGLTGWAAMVFFSPWKANGADCCPPRVTPAKAGAQLGTGLRRYDDYLIQPFSL